MAFQKGHPKFGGREKGSGDRLKRLEDMCKKHNVDFFEQLVIIAGNPEHKDHFNAIKEGCQYFLPKKKEMDHRFPEELASMMEEFQKMTTQEIQAWIKTKIKGKDD